MLEFCKFEDSSLDRFWLLRLDREGQLFCLPATREPVPSVEQMFCGLTEMERCQNLVNVCISGLLLLYGIGTPNVVASTGNKLFCSMTPTNY